VVKDGKVQVTYNQPEWREGLRYLNRLHNEGLLDPNGLTQDTVALQRLGQSDPPVLGSAPGGFPGIWVPVVEEEGARLSQYVAVPPLTGPNGFRVQPSNPYSAFTPGRFIITSAAKDPVLALRWGDGFFQQEVELNAYYGLKDLGWRWATDGEKGINGEPALNAQLKTWGNVQNDHWSQTNVSFRSSDWRLGLASDNPFALETFLYNESRKLEEYKQASETAVPPLYFAEADAQEVAEVGSTLESYVEEMMARFITGDANLDTEWETYLQTLEQQGLPRYLELLQTAYDAKATQ
jgi:putative aldouronate transport system substrate-binding protein